MFTVYLVDRVLGRFFSLEALCEGLEKLLNSAGDSLEDIVVIESDDSIVTLRTFRITQESANESLVV